MTGPARSAVRPPDRGRSGAGVWSATAVLAAVVVLCFLGVDQGAVSVFGDQVLLHESVHDARHTLGFPCH